MKLLKHSNFFSLVVISLITLSFSARSKKMMNKDINKGVSLIIDSSINPFSRTHKVLSNYNIFNFKIDIEKDQYPDLLTKTSAYNAKVNQFINDFSYHEVRKTIELEVGGGIYGVSAMSYLSEKVKRSSKSQQFNLQVMMDIDERRIISIDHNNNFPNYDQSFLYESYKLFAKNPAKKGYSTPGDLFNDRLFIRKVLNYFDKYGTHYASSMILGNKHGVEIENESPNVEKVLELDGKLVIVDNSMKEKLDSSIEVDRVTAGLVRDKNKNSRIGEFFSGECKIDKHKIQECNDNAWQLIKVEARPIYLLFDEFFISSTVNHPTKKGQKLSRKELKNIYKNIRRFHYEVTRALDIRNLIVSEVIFFYIEKSKVDTIHPCVQTKDNLFIKLMNFLKKMHKAPLSMKLLSTNKFMPVLKVENYEDVKVDDFAVAQFQTKALYMCAKKDYNLTPGDIRNGRWEKKDYVKDVKFMAAKDKRFYERLGYICKDTWEFKMGDANYKYAICIKKSHNFLENDLVTDMKFFSFPKESKKCNGFKSFVVDFHGKKYVCDCEYNLADISTGYDGLDMYFCLSRKSNRSDLINKPIDKKEAEKKD